MAEEEKNTEVFVVSAIGGDDSPQRTHADWLLEGIIDPVFQRHFPDFTVLRADRIGTPGLIDAQIIGKLLTARLVIADLTFLNPNAFYEIGIRHVVNLPIIHVHRADQSIPFDISLFRSIKYSTERPQHLRAAQEILKRTVDEVLSDGYKVENPVTQARGRAQFTETASAPDRVLQAQIEKLGARIAALENPLSLHILPRPKNVSYALGLSDEANGNALGRARPYQTLHFAPEDHMEDDALQSFKEEILAPYFGNIFVNVRNAPRVIELDYQLGALGDRDLKRIADAASKRGIYMQRV